uniref:Ternary complex factor MIP1, leucine-zipper n=1 Tax=Tanacetum cinerariifolium TaxID=118510 RepID=A0A699HKI3_TANCI|nr:ternary complex factor MIP1, leucine-zipper [Tanacetum cinerariifolium]
MAKNCKEPEEFEFYSTKDLLNKEILKLQNELKDQFVIRRELEKATVDPPLLHEPVNEDSLPKPAKDLIKEISVLEFEVKHLETYLLSLYRKAFQEYVNCPVPQEPVEDSYVQRSHSSLSLRTNPLEKSFHEALDSCHSLPLAMLERATDDLSSISRAENRDICVSANQLSEEMVKCLSTIYCQIADPPLLNHGFLSSPSDSSPRDEFVMWSPQCDGEATWAHDDFEPSMESSESCLNVVEVQGICRLDQRSSSVEHKDRKFRSLVSQLEQVDPRTLKPEEKLTFWINVHNALVMHAFLVYGTPSGTLKRISLILKASYNIGGLNISVSDIQRTILGCRLPRPGQWFQSLLFPKPRSKSSDARKDYAIDHEQPLLYFALCCGNHSDPMVRIYTPKSIFQELEVAKEEYIHTNIKIPKGQKLLLPKLVELYAKDSSLCMNGLMDVIEHSIPEMYSKSFKMIREGKSSKKIEWEIFPSGTPWLSWTALDRAKLRSIEGLESRQANKFVYTCDSITLINKQPPSISRIFGTRNILELSGADHKQVKAALVSFLKPEVLRQYIARADEEIHHHLETHWCVPVSSPFIQFNSGLKARKKLIPMLIDLLHEKRVAHEEQKRQDNSSTDLFTSLLSVRDDDSSAMMSDEEIIDNIIVVMVAGYDTTSILLTFLNKKKYPRVKAPGEDLTWEDLTKMKYTWRVAFEMLRINHPAILTFRRAAQDIEATNTIKINTPVIEIDTSREPQINDSTCENIDLRRQN